MAAGTRTASYGVDGTAVPKSAIVLIGRFFFALIFLMSGPNHFSPQTIAYAASQGVPLASIAVPLSGIIAVAGGVSSLVGYLPQIGAWVSVLFPASLPRSFREFL